MAYETLTTANYPMQDATVSVPAVTSVLHDLAEATKVLAAASERFIQAREALNEAQARFSKMYEVVVKEREQAGV